ncbi:type IV secretion system protein [Aggregatibacter actinomycetemcomitans]|uniref:type IV secretion system protein n=1 Tax=Aggregatibacter actinomycetemcomitans TaxID=714 RepID=UPI002D77CD05|nr:type IV secretion system protein [Aggregatibacter actinomycetemcomitans]
MLINIIFIFWGGMILAGKVQAPVSEMIWKCISLSVIMSFLKGDMLNMAKEAVKSLSELGGVSGLSVLDKFYEDIFSLSNEVYDAESNPAAIFLWLIIWIGFILACVPFVLSILISKVTLYFLLGLAPIYIFCLMWGWLKDSFASYLSALITNAINLFAITLVYSLLISSLLEKMTIQESTGKSPFFVAISTLVLGVVSGYLIRHIYSVISGISRVSVERVGASIGQAVNASKSARDTASNLTSPSSGAMAKSQVAAAASQIQTQKELQQVARQLNKVLDGK